jgi:hypothetical protein
MTIAEEAATAVNSKNAVAAAAKWINMKPGRH